jgi:hypothetical protein
MKLTTINKGNEAVCTVRIPSSMAEVTVAQYTAYETAKLQLSKAEKAVFESDTDKTFTELGHAQQIAYIKAIIKMLNAFGVFEVVEGQQFDPLDLPFEVVTGLWLQFYRTVVSYAPTPINSFIHNGITYIVPAMLENGITKELINPNLPTKQVFTMLQYERKISLLEQQQNKIFAVKYVSIAAILCNKEGENFAHLEEQEFDRLLEKRIKEFETLPMDTLLNVMFFFGILPKI